MPPKSQKATKSKLSAQPPTEKDITVTGVLLLPEVTVTHTFPATSTLRFIASACFSSLADRAKESFDLDTPLSAEKAKIAVYKSGPHWQTGDLQPVTNIEFGDPTINTYVIMYSMPPADAAFIQTYVQKYNKENLAAAFRESLVREEDVKSAKKRVEKKLMSAQSPSSFEEMMERKFREYDEKFAKQENTIVELRRTIDEQQKTITEQQKTITEQQKTINELSTEVKRQARALNVLTRRIELDKARDKITDKYRFEISDLRLRWYETLAERQAALRMLVQSVRVRLDQEDCALLTDDALRMIFDGSKGTIRAAGNEVAHEASLSAISLAVLGGDLTPAQSQTLQSIFKFTHNGEPGF